MVDPLVRILLSSMNTNGGFYLSLPTKENFLRLRLTGMLFARLWCWTHLTHCFAVLDCLFVMFWFNNAFNIPTVSGCDRELNAHFNSATSLKYHAPDTWHDTTLSHIILTLSWPVLALPCKSECQARSSLSTSFIFNDFVMSRPGIEPVTARSPEWTFFWLSYRGRFAVL